MTWTQIGLKDQVNQWRTTADARDAKC